MFAVPRDFSDYSVTVDSHEMAIGETKDTGCTLEGKYDLGCSFTEVRLPNKLRLLISNAEISGIVEK